MNRDFAIENANRNLCETYMGIALTVPDTRSLSGKGWYGCKNSKSYPMCNFAVVNIDHGPDLSEVEEFTEGNRGFLVYTLSSTYDESPLGIYFCRREVQHNASLATMVKTGSLSCDEFEITLKFARGLDDRMRLGFVVAKEFFPKQHLDAQSAIASSTAMSPFDIAEILFQSTPIGVLMLNSRSESIGIYNFCIRSEYRNRGFGSRVLQLVQKIAAQKNCIICLQCGLHLVPWYERNGFEIVANVDIWMLDYLDPLAIIG